MESEQQLYKCINTTGEVAESQHLRLGPLGASHHCHVLQGSEGTQQSSDRVLSYVSDSTDILVHQCQISNRLTLRQHVTNTDIPNGKRVSTTLLHSGPFPGPRLLT